MTGSEAERRTVGLDAHPDVFTAAILAGADAGTARPVRVSPSLPLPQLEGWMQRHTQPTDQIVLEASGNSFDLQRRLLAVGRNAQVLDSRRVGQVSKAYCAHDKGDAIKIARVWLSGLAHVVWTPDDTTQLRRDILQRYTRAVRDAARCSNRVKSYLSDHSVRLPKGTRLTLASVQTRLVEHTRWSSVQRDLLRGLLEDLNYAHSRRTALRRTITREVLTDPLLRSLVRLFGVREILAFAVGALVGDVHRFQSPKQLVAYIGLNPRVVESGASAANGPLAHHGRKDLRALLIQAAHALLRHQNPLYRWGRHLAIRKGTNLAVVAVARKLTVAIWYLLHGRFSPLLEVDQTLRIKIRKLAVILGLPAIRELGFETSGGFQEHLTKQLLTSTA
jgi:transposase